MINPKHCVLSLWLYACASYRCPPIDDMHMRIASGRDRWRRRLQMTGRQATDTDRNWSRRGLCVCFSRLSRARCIQHTMYSATYGACVCVCVQCLAALVCVIVLAETLHKCEGVSVCSGSVDTGERWCGEHLSDKATCAPRIAAHMDMRMYACNGRLG